MFCKYCGTGGTDLHKVCEKCGRNGFDYDQNGFDRCSEIYELFKDNKDIHLIMGGSKGDTETADRADNNDHAKPPEHIHEKKPREIHNEPLNDYEEQEEHSEALPVEERHSDNRWRIWIIPGILCLAAAILALYLILSAGKQGDSQEPSEPDSDIMMSAIVTSNTDVQTTETVTETSVTDVPATETVTTEGTVFSGANAEEFIRNNSEMSMHLVNDNIFHGYYDNIDSSNYGTMLQDKLYSYYYDTVQYKLWNCDNMTDMEKRDNNILPSQSGYCMYDGTGSINIISARENAVSVGSDSYESVWSEIGDVYNARPHSGWVLYSSTPCGNITSYSYSGVAYSGMEYMENAGTMYMSDQSLFTQISMDYISNKNTVGHQFELKDQITGQLIGYAYIRKTEDLDYSGINSCFVAVRLFNAGATELFYLNESTLYRVHYILNADTQHETVSYSVPAETTTTAAVSYTAARVTNTSAVKTTALSTKRSTTKTVTQTVITSHSEAVTQTNDNISITEPPADESSDTQSDSD